MLELLSAGRLTDLAFNTAFLRQVSSLMAYDFHLLGMGGKHIGKISQESLGCYRLEQC